MDGWSELPTHVNEPDTWCSSILKETLEGLTVIRRIGRGTFGRVDLVRNAEGAELVVKRQELVTNRKLREEAVIEVDFLMRLGGCPQILPIRGICSDWSLDLKMLLPKMDGDLNWYFTNVSLEARAENYDYFLTEMALALDALVQAGLIHGDIKPGNILVSCGPLGTDNSTPKFYLADFGISVNARLFESVPWDMYTSWWRPPEYFLPDYPRNGVPLGASDMWALGITAYQYLTNKHLVSFDSSVTNDDIYRYLEKNDNIADENFKIQNLTRNKFTRDLIAGKSYYPMMSNRPDRMLIRKMLNFNPLKRLTPEVLLRTLGVDQVPLPGLVLAPPNVQTHEPIADKSVKIFTDAFELKSHQKRVFYDVVQDIYRRIGGLTTEDRMYSFIIAGTYFYLDSRMIRQLFPPNVDFQEWKIGVYLARLQYVVLNPALELDPKFYTRHNQFLRNREFYAAVAAGNIGFVGKAFEEGADINFGNGAPLKAAVATGDVPMVRLLLAAQANVHIDNDQILVDAAGNPEIFGLVFAAGGQRPGPRVTEIQEKAAANGHNDILTTLILNGAVVTQNALLSAVANGHVETVRLLLRESDVIPPDAALVAAATNGDTELVTLLLNAGVDPNARGSAAIKTAAAAGHTGVVRLLINAGGKAPSLSAIELIRNSTIGATLRSAGFEESKVDGLIRKMASLLP